MLIFAYYCERLKIKKMSKNQQNELQNSAQPHSNPDFWYTLYLNVSNRSVEYAGIVGKSMGIIETMIPLLQDKDQRKFYEEALYEIRKTLSDIGINGQ